MTCAWTETRVLFWGPVCVDQKRQAVIFLPFEEQTLSLRTWLYDFINRHWLTLCNKFCLKTWMETWEHSATTCSSYVWQPQPLDQTSWLLCARWMTSFQARGCDRVNFLCNFSRGFPFFITRVSIIWANLDRFSRLMPTSPFGGIWLVCK